MTTTLGKTSSVVKAVCENCSWKTITTTADTLAFVFRSAHRHASAYEHSVRVKQLTETTIKGEANGMGT